jgi:uncharacterized phage protein (TIGR02216 family)
LSDPFPWDAVIRLALSQWGLSPDALWRLTPREIASALRPARPAPLSADDLSALLARFPDEP